MNKRDTPSRTSGGCAPAPRLPRWAHGPRLILPSPALSPPVQAYRLLDEDHPRAERHVFLPEQLAHLTFSSGRSWVLGGGGLPAPVPRAMPEGLVTAPAHLYSEGPVRALRAELYPWAP